MGLARLGVHHQQQHRRPSEGRASTTPTVAAGPEEPGAKQWRAATRRRARSTVEKIVEGVATIAAAFWPKTVIVRLSDFKSNEYTQPDRRRALRAARRRTRCSGFRGASRYIAHEFRECFALECEAMREGARRDGPHQRARSWCPFVRTLKRGRAASLAIAGARTASSAARTACASS